MHFGADAIAPACMKRAKKAFVGGAKYTSLPQRSLHTTCGQIPLKFFAPRSIDPDGVAFCQTGCCR